MQQPPPPPPSKRRIHDGEVIANFAAVGTLASVDIIVRQDIDDGGVGTIVLLAGALGGGAAGYLLTQKYEVDAGAARSTTIGTMAGVANGALLIEPILGDDPTGAEVMTLLFLGSAVGATGGFVYGQAADLTEGQAMFIGNSVLLGSATAALGAITGSRDGQFGNWESGTLVTGLDAGLIAGALVAPSLDWSKKRARIVFASTALGALAGGMIAGLSTDKNSDDEYNGDLVAGCMTAGLWAGFGLGVLMTRDAAPDPKFGEPSRPAVAPAAATRSPTSFAPFLSERGIGLMAGGTW